MSTFEHLWATISGDNNATADILSFAVGLVKSHRVENDSVVEEGRVLVALFKGAVELKLSIIIFL